MNSYNDGSAYTQTDGPLQSGQNFSQDQKRAIAATLTGTATLGRTAYALNWYDTNAAVEEPGAGILPKENAAYDGQTNMFHNVHHLDEQVDFVAYPTEQVADNEDGHIDNGLGDDFNNHADVSGFVA